jgi:hypothetical protein
MDAITSSIFQLNQKVNDVDMLRLELRLVKSRLKRLEDSSRGIQQSANSDLRSTLPRKRKAQPYGMCQENQSDLSVSETRRRDGNTKLSQLFTDQELDDMPDQTKDTVNDESMYVSRPASRS